MINEVLPGCKLDCRNFIAFSNNVIPRTFFKNSNQFKNSEIGIFNACIDDEIIKVNF